MGLDWIRALPGGSSNSRSPITPQMGLWKRPVTNEQGPGSQSPFFFWGCRPFCAFCLSESDCRTKTAGLVIAATILFLLATAIGLGVLYGQVSGQLWWSSQDHADRSSVLAQTLNQSLEEMEIQLRKAEKDLNGTRLALKESQAARERTQRLLEKVEGQLRDANRNMDAAELEKEQTAAALRQAASLLQKEEEQRVQTERILVQMRKEQEEAQWRLTESGAELEPERSRSCQEIGCCPPRWILFRWKCLWVSEERKTWEDSKEECKRRGSRLMIPEEPWDSGGPWQEAQTSSLEPDQFWIGLGKKWLASWRWVDERPFPRPESLSECGRKGNCGQLRRGSLRQCHCGTLSRYICEIAASPVRPAGRPDASLLGGQLMRMAPGGLA